ncbi:MAG: hypothetical protein M0C28_36910 [Candidatus Moduliflexus flocculans]|nr:hypothetical protein [Candidatus Moduliflexus flocculans]
MPYDEPSGPARGAGGERERKRRGRNGARPAPAGWSARDRGGRERGPVHLAGARRAVAGPSHRPLLQYSRRSVFGSVPSVVVTTPALLFEDGVYDDPYASEASAVRGALKHVFAGGAEAQIEGYRLDKAYVSTVASTGPASRFRTGRSEGRGSGAPPPRRRCPSSAPAPRPSPSRSS